MYICIYVSTYIYIHIYMKIGSFNLECILQETSMVQLECVYIYISIYIYPPSSQMEDRGGRTFRNCILIFHLRSQDVSSVMFKIANTMNTLYGKHALHNHGGLASELRPLLSLPLIGPMAK